MNYTKSTRYKMWSVVTHNLLEVFKPCKISLSAHIIFHAVEGLIRRTFGHFVSTSKTTKNIKSWKGTAKSVSTVKRLGSTPMGQWSRPKHHLIQQAHTAAPIFAFQVLLHVLPPNRTPSKGFYFYNLLVTIILFIENCPWSLIGMSTLKPQTIQQWFSTRVLR